MNTVFVGFILLMMIALSPSRNSDLPVVYDSEVGVSLVGLMVQERMMVVLVNVIMVMVVVVVVGKSMDMIPMRVGMKTQRHFVSHRLSHVWMATNLHLGSRQLSSTRPRRTVMENTSWSRTVEEKYQREVLPQLYYSSVISFGESTLVIMWSV